MNEEILLEQYKNSNSPKYDIIYNIIKELSKLYIKKSLVEFDKLNKFIDINLNLGELILIKISLDIEDNNPKDYLFSIYRNGEVLITNSLPIKVIVNKLLKVQNKLNLI